LQPFEWHGQWRLPGKPDWVGGILHFTPEAGLKLSLLGSLTSLEALINGPDYYPLIHGLTTDGQSVTLRRCYQTHAGFGTGATSEQFLAHECFEGALFEAEEEVLFDVVKIAFRAATGWCKATGLNWEREAPREITLNYRQVEDSVALTPSKTIRMLIEPKSSRRPHEFSISEGLVFEIRSAGPLPLAAIDAEIIGPIRNLVTLFTGTPWSIDGLSVCSPQLNMQVGQQQRPIPLELYRNPIFGGSEGLESVRQLVEYAWFSEHFASVVSLWLKACSDIGTAMNLFFGLLDLRSVFQEQRFLLAMQALEAYHRHRFKNRILPEEEHQGRVRAVLEAVPSLHKKWVSSMLAFTNEPRLNNRLSELVQRLGDLPPALYEAFRDFGPEAVRARNYLTHYDPKAKRGAPSVSRLVLLTSQAQLLMSGLLLLEVGAQQAEVQGFITKSGHIQTIAAVRTQL